MNKELRGVLSVLIIVFLIGSMWFVITFSGIIATVAIILDTWSTAKNGIKQFFSDPVRFYIKYCEWSL